MTAIIANVVVFAIAASIILYSLSKVVKKFSRKKKDGDHDCGCGCGCGCG